MSEEVFDIVDETDRVVGQAPRSEVHARGLLHRAVHIFVFNTAGELLVHKRTAGKDEYPLRYTSSASGHLAAGEGYDEAAARELEEELGLRTPIEFLEKFPAGTETAQEHTALYRTVTDEPPECHPGEIESAAYYPTPRLAALIRDDPERFTPSFRKLFGWYAENEGR